MVIMVFVLAGIVTGAVLMAWWLIIPPCLCRKSIPNTTEKKTFLVITSCTWNVSSSIAIDSEVIPSAIRGLSSAPETENCIGCSSRTKDNEQYSCSSKRLIKEPVSFKIVIALWYKVPDTRHWWSFTACFWMTLLYVLFWPGVLDLLAWHLLSV